METHPDVIAKEIKEKYDLQIDTCNVYGIPLLRHDPNPEFCQILVTGMDSMFKSFLDYDQPTAHRLATALELIINTVLVNSTDEDLITRERNLSKSEFKFLFFPQPGNHK